MDIKGKWQTSKKAILGGLLFLFLTIAAYGCLNSGAGTQTSVGNQSEVYVRIAPGMDAVKVAALLKQKQVIDNEFTFRLAAKLNGSASRFKTGDYHFRQHMDNSAVMVMLVEGKTSSLRVTIPEGYSVEQIARSLAEKGVVEENVFAGAAAKFRAYDYMTANNKTKYQAEGFLFPDTYEFAEGSTAESILAMMAKEFDQQLTPEMRERARQMGLSIRELIILASLVEKEAQVDEDRPIIAQVFINRLKADMPLQSCATIQYILGNPKAELSIQDTEIDSPYNTYRHQGLPPGPIANPGLASIKAVLDSQPTKYLYFVADKQGRHHFSQTYDEHLATIDTVR